MYPSNFKPFMTGVLFSTCIFILLSFTTSWNNSEQSTSDVISIPSDSAETYKSNFASVYPRDSKGINVSIKQWKAMNRIVTEMNNDLTNISGFRFYYGLSTESTSATKYAMAYALNNALEMPVKGSTGASGMVTTSNDLRKDYVEDCPPFCD